MKAFFMVFIDSSCLENRKPESATPPKKSASRNNSLYSIIQQGINGDQQKSSDSTTPSNNASTTSNSGTNTQVLSHLPLPPSTTVQLLLPVVLSLTYSHTNPLTRSSNTWLLSRLPLHPVLTLRYPHTYPHPQY